MTTVPVPRHDRRDELAAAAYALIAEGGLDGFSLRAAARRLRATTGLVSHHFVDRADLVAAALDHAAGVLLERVLSVPADAHPCEVLATVLPVDADTIEVWRFSLCIRTAALFDAEFRRFDDRIRDLWLNNLPDRLVGFVQGDRAEATRRLVAVVDGVALQAVLDPANWPAERQRSQLDMGFDLLRDGVTS